MCICRRFGDVERAAAQAGHLPARGMFASESESSDEDPEVVTYLQLEVARTAAAEERAALRDAKQRRAEEAALAIAAVVDSNPSPSVYEIKTAVANALAPRREGSTDGRTRQHLGNISAASRQRQPQIDEPVYTRAPARQACLEQSVRLIQAHFRAVQLRRRELEAERCVRLIQHHVRTVQSRLRAARLRATQLIAVRWKRAFSRRKLWALQSARRHMHASSVRRLLQFCRRRWSSRARQSQEAFAQKAIQEMIAARELMRLLREASTTLRECFLTAHTYPAVSPPHSVLCRLLLASALQLALLKRLLPTHLQGLCRLTLRKRLHERQQDRALREGQAAAVVQSRWWRRQNERAQRAALEADVDARRAREAEEWDASQAPPETQGERERQQVAVYREPGVWRVKALQRLCRRSLSWWRRSAARAMALTAEIPNPALAKTLRTLQRLYPLVRQHAFRRFDLLVYDPQSGCLSGARVSRSEHGRLIPRTLWRVDLGQLSVRYKGWAPHGVRLFRSSPQGGFSQVPSLCRIKLIEWAEFTTFVRATRGGEIALMPYSPVRLRGKEDAMQRKELATLRVLFRRIRHEYFPGRLGTPFEQMRRVGLTRGDAQAHSGLNETVGRVAELTRQNSSLERADGWLEVIRSRNRSLQHASRSRLPALPRSRSLAGLSWPEPRRSPAPPLPHLKGGGALHSAVWLPRNCARASTQRRERPPSSVRPVREASEPRAAANQQ